MHGASLCDMKAWESIQCEADGLLFVPERGHMQSIGEVICRTCAKLNPRFPTFFVNE